MTESQRKAHDAAERVVAVCDVCDVLLDLVPSDVETFAADVRTQWAVEMGLIRIGEAVNRIPDAVLDIFPHQPWRQIVAMRNLAAHQYDDLDPRRVWRTVSQDVPSLRAYLTDTVIPTLRVPWDSSGRRSERARPGGVIEVRTPSRAAPSVLKALARPDGAADAFNEHRTAVGWTT